LFVVDKLLCGRRILVVEDETLILMMIEAMLADLGCESVTAAATVDKALALVDAQVFDAAMLDMNMDGNTSHSVAEALVARGVPFIYCSGNNNQKYTHVYHDRPMLKKPFKHEELAKILARLLSP
jgi:CheY-like chemotaxis protein